MAIVVVVVVMLVREVVDGDGGAETERELEGVEMFGSVWGSERMVSAQGIVLRTGQGMVWENWKKC